MTSPILNTEIQCKMQNQQKHFLFIVQTSLTKLCTAFKKARKVKVATPSPWLTRSNFWSQLLLKFREWCESTFLWANGRKVTGSHKIFGANHYLNSKKLVMQIKISKKWNNDKKVIRTSNYMVCRAITD